MSSIASGSAAGPTVVWTQQHPDLWAGRRDGMPVGTIERGHRFTFIGLDGVRSSGWRTLMDAERVATRPGAAARRPVPIGRLDRALVIASTVAAVTTVSLLAAAAPVLL